MERKARAWPPGLKTWGAAAQSKTRNASAVAGQCTVRSSSIELLRVRSLHPASASRRTCRCALLCATLELSCTSADNGLIHRSMLSDSGGAKRCGMESRRLQTTGHLSSRHPVVVGAGDVAWGSRRRGGRRRARAPGAVLSSVRGFSSVTRL